MIELPLRRFATSLTRWMRKTVAQSEERFGPPTPCKRDGPVEKNMPHHAKWLRARRQYQSCRRLDRSDRKLVRLSHEAELARKRGVTSTRPIGLANLARRFLHGVCGKRPVHDSAAAKPQRLPVESAEAVRLLVVSPRTSHTLKATGEIHQVQVERSVQYAIADLEERIRVRKREGGKR